MLTFAATPDAISQESKRHMEPSAVDTAQLGAHANGKREVSENGAHPHGKKGSLENTEGYENVPRHVIPILQREFDHFDTEATRFLDKEIEEDEFIGFR